MNNSLVPATASSRYLSPIYWRDPAGRAYIVQVPLPNLNSPTNLNQIPMNGSAGWTLNVPAETPLDGSGYAATGGGVLLRDIASLGETATPAAVDRYNMRRMVTLTANLATPDLGRVGRLVRWRSPTPGRRRRG